MALELIKGVGADVNLTQGQFVIGGNTPDVQNRLIDVLLGGATDTPAAELGAQIRAFNQQPCGCKRKIGPGHPS